MKTAVLWIRIQTAVCALSVSISYAEDRVRYNRDVLPILSSNCFACHGPDAGQRQAELRLDVRDQAVSAKAIVPGKTRDSGLIARITTDDEEHQMPPPDANRQLNQLQKDILIKWVAQGAEYEQHWSYVSLRSVGIPQVISDRWPRNGIDHFILQRLENEGLAAAPEAAKETLIRRLTFDLTGLPPTPAEVQAFIADCGPQAYEAVVDRLLQSPSYGERMAVDWLDAARYADSNGYQVDRDRELWPWRDWVVRAFNDNMPFDQFTIEQLAGDLLPNPTLDQRIATGFHRNHMLNEEGGIIADEFLAEYTADRVETTAAVWLGQTFNCARCHDHKFDPFTQRDFYAMKAFFHNVPERGVGIYSNPIRENAPPFIKLPTSASEQQLATMRASLSSINAQLAALAEETSLGLDAWCQSIAQAEVKLEMPLPDSLRSIAMKTAAERSVAETKQLMDFRLQQHPDTIRLSREAKAVEEQIANLEAEIPTTLVMEEMSEPRATFVLVRGAYDKPGDSVTAATPSALPALGEDLPLNRLGLAKWLVSPQNPLTARVTVNRFWQQVFGSGLVTTSEDFGTQGALPSHPELLDWLASEFIRSDWNVKQLMKLIVTSASYRQQSQLTPVLQARDPENRLLARGPRFRLPAEMIRDQALAASGLLISSLGGAPVKPYHPAGLYEQITSGKGTNIYVPGQGQDLYRRSLYTYWKRSVPHPAMLLFDVPFRESCALRRPRSNTPLQALNLMNDPTYVEAARCLAQRMIRDGGETVASRIAHGFALVLARQPREPELAILKTAVERAHADFLSDPAAAQALLAVGASASDTRVDSCELAAYTTAANTILNLAETITK